MSEDECLLGIKIEIKIRIRLINDAFGIDDNKLLQNYPTIWSKIKTIWTKIFNALSNALPAHEVRYIKTYMRT